MSLTQTDKDYFTGIIEGAVIRAATLTTDSCDKHWNKKAQTMGDGTTGEDLLTTEGRANVRKAYEYIKVQMNRSNLVAKTVVVEIVKLAIVAAIVILGIKA